MYNPIVYIVIGRSILPRVQIMFIIWFYRYDPGQIETQLYDITCTGSPS